MPENCTGCVFYSAIRKRCLKLGIEITDPSNPPCNPSPRKAEPSQVVRKPVVSRPLPAKLDERLRRGLEKVKRDTRVGKPVKGNAEGMVDELVKAYDLYNNYLLKYNLFIYSAKDPVMRAKIGLAGLPGEKMLAAVKEAEGRRKTLENRVEKLKREALRLGARKCGSCGMPVKKNWRKCRFCGANL